MMGFIVLTIQVNHPYGTMLTDLWVLILALSVTLFYDVASVTHHLKLDSVHSHYEVSITVQWTLVSLWANGIYL